MKTCSAKTVKSILDSSSIQTRHVMAFTLLIILLNGSKSMLADAPNPLRLFQANAATTDPFQTHNTVGNEEPVLKDYCRPAGPCMTDGGLMLTKTNTRPCCLKMIKGLISAYHVIRSCWDVSLQPYTAGGESIQSGNNRAYKNPHQIESSIKAQAWTTMMKSGFLLCSISWYSTGTDAVYTADISSIQLKAGP